MGLGSQFFQRLLRVLHGFALGAEGCIAQTRATVFVGWAIAKAASTASSTATTTTRVVAWATRRTGACAIAATGAIVTALARSATTAHRCGRIFLHARAVVAAHRYHRARCRLGRGYGGGLGGCGLAGIGCVVSVSGISSL